MIRPEQEFARAAAATSRTEITMRRGRSAAMKRALYANIAANLEKNAGVAPNDVFIFMHENDYSDWSVGGGKFAMAIVQQVGPGA